MKNKTNLIKLLTGLLVVILSACEPNENAFLDVNNLDNSVARFQSGNTLVYNPVENVANEIQVGVSTLSSEDRTFELILNEEATTLPDNFYSIESLTGVIPAGSFVGSVIVTTLGAENSNLPSASARMSFTLDSLEDATLVTGSLLTVNVPLAVACPTVDLPEVSGFVNQQTMFNELAAAFGLPANAFGPSEVFVGPGENQLTIVGGFGTESSDDLIINVDPVTGEVSNASPEGTLIFINGGTLPVPVTGIRGNVLTCINQIDIDVENAIFGGTLSAFTLTVNID